MFVNGQLVIWGTHINQHRPSRAIELETFAPSSLHQIFRSEIDQFHVVPTSFIRGLVSDDLFHRPITEHASLQIRCRPIADLQHGRFAFYAACGIGDSDRVRSGIRRGQGIKAQHRICCSGNRTSVFEPLELQWSGSTGADPQGKGIASNQVCSSLRLQGNHRGEGWDRGLNPVRHHIPNLVYI